MSATAVIAEAPPRAPLHRPAPPERLSGPDAAWWHMERPENQMVITGVLTFAEPLDFDRVSVAVRTRLLAHRRFRQRVDESAGHPRWVDDARFSLARHLRRATLPAPGGRRELQHLVGEMMSRPLDPRRPLWEAVVADGYAGGSAIVVRVHHCIADGMALIHVLLTLDDQPGNEDEIDGFAPRGWTPATLRGLRVPASLAGKVAFAVRTALSVMATLARLLLMRGDPPSSFRGRLGMRKTAAWSDPLPLDEVKRVAKALGGTVHDVLAAAAAGGMREYEKLHGRRFRRPVRAVVPVNLREMSGLGALGNRFGLVFLPLPVGLSDAVERESAVKRTMDRLKRSPEARVLYAILRLVGRLPKWVERLIVAFLGKNATLVMTDVPGPRETIWFCGRRVREVMAWVPQSGRLGLGVSILSYAGRVQVGVAADAGLVPDPEALVAAFARSFAELRAAALG
ncbi:MAG TPA: wax ester/triacylglycerol synthase family O-acyltransferase [Longimicrobium sp.]